MAKGLDELLISRYSMSESKQIIAPYDFVLSVILHKVYDNASFWTTSKATAYARHEQDNPRMQSA